MVDELTNKQQDQVIEAPKEDKDVKKLDMVEEAKKAAKELSALNLQAAEYVRQLQEAQSQEILGGTADTPPEQKKEEISPEDYANAAIEGKILE